jgi:hypothetical protein
MCGDGDDCPNGPDGRQLAGDPKVTRRCGCQVCRIDVLKGSRERPTMFVGHLLARVRGHIRACVQRSCTRDRQRPADREVAVGVPRQPSSRALAAALEAAEVEQLIAGAASEGRPLQCSPTSAPGLSSRWEGDAARRSCRRLTCWSRGVRIPVRVLVTGSRAGRTRPSTAQRSALRDDDHPGRVRTAPNMIADDRAQLGFRRPTLPPTGSGTASAPGSSATWRCAQHQARPKSSLDGSPGDATPSRPRA